MQEFRCPDCGYRLKTKECPICLKRVPFPVAKKEPVTPRPVEMQAPRTFSEKPKRHTAIPIDWGKLKKAAQTKKKLKPGTIFAIVLAAISLLTPIFEAIDPPSAYTEPEYNYEAYVPAGVGDAAGVPGVDAQCVYDADGITITVDGIGLYYDSYTIPVTVVNNTEDDLVVHGVDMSVNSYMMPSLNLYCEVESGEESQTLLILDDYDLEEVGITEIAEVAFWLDIYEDEDYTNVAKTDLITLRTEIADGFVQPVDDSGMEVYAGEDVRLVVKNVELSNYDYCTITVFAQNDSDMTVTLRDDGITINEELTYGMLWSTLRPHTQIVDRIYIDDLEELGIETLADLGTMVLELDVGYDGNGTSKAVSETVEIDLTKVTE